LNNFTKNRYIAYIIVKPLERILTHISKFLRDFIVYFYDAISSSSEKCKTLQWFFGPLYNRAKLKVLKKQEKWKDHEKVANMA